MRGRAPHGRVAFGLGRSRPVGGGWRMGGPRNRCSRRTVSRRTGSWRRAAGGARLRSVTAAGGGPVLGEDRCCRGRSCRYRALAELSPRLWGRVTRPSMGWPVVCGRRPGRGFSSSCIIVDTSALRCDLSPPPLALRAWEPYVAHSGQRSVSPEPTSSRRALSVSPRRRRVPECQRTAWWAVG
jgi:hypothetical protein